MTTIQDLYAAVDAAAQAHFAWCTSHDYSEPDIEICKARIPLEFPPFGKPGDDVDALNIELSGSDIDVRHGFNVPRVAIGYNGGSAGREMDAWKLKPFAFALLAADAHVRGDLDEARAFLDAANLAITEHLTEQPEAEPEPEYAVVEPARHWSEGPFSYVQGGDPDAPLIPWSVYQAHQATITVADCGHFRIMADGKPLDEVHYTDEAAAQSALDKLKAGAA